MKGKARQANFELLRIIAMMMVVVLHYLGKSGLLGNLERDNLTTVNTAAWVCMVIMYTKLF